MRRINCQRIYESASLLYPERRRFGRILLHLRVMNGFVGLFLAGKRRQETYVLRKHFRSLKAECVAPAVGSGAFIERSSVKTKTPPDDLSGLRGQDENLHDVGESLMNMPQDFVLRRYVGVYHCPSSVMNGNSVASSCSRFFGALSAADHIAVWTSKTPEVKIEILFTDFAFMDIH